MRRFLWFFSLIMWNQIAFSQTLSEKIEALIKQKLPNATVGIMVKDAKTGQVIYNNNANKLLSPASNIKLFTAAAALYHLKTDYRFLTTLSKHQQNIYLTFTGSPSFTSENLSALIRDLKKHNINQINGSFVLDTSRFKSPYYPNGTSYDDLGWYYSAPDTTVIINENAVAYDFISANKLGDPVQIIPKSAATTLNIINELITVNKEQAKEHCGLHVEIKANNTLRVFGCMVQMKQAMTMHLAVPDPVLMAKQLIQKELNEQGILLKGQIIEGHTPSDATVLSTVQSADLTTLITHMLHDSDNLYANSITKELAYSLTKTGSYKQGIFAMKEILAQHTKVDLTQMELADGEGTRYNLATPEQIVILLTGIYNNKSMQELILKALPQAGVSGTLKGRMKGSILEKNLFAKTGSMHDISSLSGYIVYPNKHPLIFSIIINGINKPIDIARSLEEQLLLLIVNEHGNG